MKTLPVIRGTVDARAAALRTIEIEIRALQTKAHAIETLPARFLDWGVIGDLNHIAAKLAELNGKE